jgi:hypothetical protein
METAYSFNNTRKAPPTYRPSLRVACRTEAVDAHRRRSVRNAQEDLNGSQRTRHGHNETLDETVARLDTRTGRGFPNGYCHPAKGQLKQN